MIHRQKNIFFSVFRDKPLNKGIGNFFFGSNYDLYGNMTKDENKNINTIIYNHLNLPTEIQFTQNRTIKYQYDALGVKRKKEVFDGTYTTITEYIDGYQYENKPVELGGRGYNHLLFFPHGEGYVKPVFAQDKSNKLPKYSYVFNHLDHLGNIRVSYAKVDGEIKVLEETNYYPFGLSHSSYNQTRKKLSRKISNDLKTATPTIDNPYKVKFQGQERQEEFDLNWDSFKWRNYAFDSGRFMSIDPLTEEYHSWSPYVFSGNRVVDARELEGLEPFFINEELANTPSSSSSSFLDGWNQSVGQFNLSFSNGIHNFMNDPIGTASNVVSNTLESAATVAGHLAIDVTGISNATGRENKTVGVLNQIVDDVKNIPNLTKNDLGSATGQTVTLALEMLFTKRLPGGKGIKTSNGTKITGFKKHGLNQKMNRNVKSIDMLDAIKNPLKVGDVKIDHLGRPSQRHIGRKATIAVNPETGKVVSVNPTSTKRAKRLEKQQQN